MSGFSFESCQLKDAILITPFFQGDLRGGFTKLFEKDIYAAGNIPFMLNESFVSISGKNVIRGMHFQLHHPQAKLVTVLKGSAFDVIVDLRKDSPTYKQWQGFELNDQNHLLLYVPRGFAHGFLSREDQTMMLYQCEGPYDKETDTGIRFDDPEIGIKWPVDDIGKCIHSERDLRLMSFQEYEMNPIDND